jgi:Ni,Fe-hydrogenase III small subunit
MDTDQAENSFLKGPCRVYFFCRVYMANLIAKIFSTPRKIIDIKDLSEQKDLLAIGKQINGKVKKLFKGSLAIREVDAGSDNAIEQELTALSNAYYDSERFGVHFVASPRHADMLIVTGPVSRNMRQAVVRSYEATPDPKIIVAVGDETIDGGIFKDSYAIVGGVDKVIPVDYGIKGNPPSPLTILRALLYILNDLDNGK